MRIAFVGKGGSGKTTIASLTSRSLAADNRTVLAIDADINQHLAEAVGMPSHLLPELGNHLDVIKDYLRGTNLRISSAEAMVKTTPPGTGSRLLHLDEPNPLFGRFERRVHGVRLLRVGQFTEEDLGV